MSKKVFNENRVKKDDEFQLLIEDLGSEGEGIGRVDGYTLFVKDALKGDLVKVKVIKTKKAYGYARLLQIQKPSPDRVQPRCPIARQCGGCQLQHLDYEKQLAYKQGKVKNCLERIGKFENIDLIMEPIIGMENPYYYRNKAQFPVGKDKNGNIVIGFYAGRTHSIIDTDHCYIQGEVNQVILKKVKAFIIDNKLDPYEEGTNKGFLRHILNKVGFATGEIMVCFIINGDKMPYQEKLVDSLKEIPGMTSISYNINKEKTNVILGDKVVTIWGQDYITDYIGEIKYQISPLSFYQVNPIQTQKLYETALEFADLSGDEIVWDLYCGIGTISLFLAQNAKQVYGVEIVPEAIEDAKINAQINQIENAKFFVGAAEVILPAQYQETGVKADVIVVDPPRKGCEETLLDTIVKMEPKKVVYVSCDPATLARDLRYLCDRGYEVKRVRPCDMFGHSVHVETCCLLYKR
jgi:23S rRNA (uracil1939-C5)-methyltransferase